MKNIKRIIRITMVALTMAIAIPTQAQMFIMDDEFEGELRLESDEDYFFIMDQGEGTDAFTPLGDGLIVLSCLGGAYLLAKRKRSNKKR